MTPVKQQLAGPENPCPPHCAYKAEHDDVGEKLVGGAGRAEGGRVGRCVGVNVTGRDVGLVVWGCEGDIVTGRDDGKAVVGDVGAFVPEPAKYFGKRTAKSAPPTEGEGLPVTSTSPEFTSGWLQLLPVPGRQAHAVQEYPRVVKIVRIASS